MPEATVLYSVTAAVVVGLVGWVAVVLKSAKEPWARDVPPEAPKPDVPLEAEPLATDVNAAPDANAPAPAAFETPTSDAADADAADAKATTTTTKE